MTSKIPRGIHTTLSRKLTTCSDFDNFLVEGNVLCDGLIQNIMNSLFSDNKNMTVNALWNLF